MIAVVLLMLPGILSALCTWRTHRWLVRAWAAPTPSAAQLMVMCRLVVTCSWVHASVWPRSPSLVIQVGYNVIAVSYVCTDAHLCLCLPAPSHPCLACTRHRLQAAADCRALLQSFEHVSIAMPTCAVSVERARVVEPLKLSVRATHVVAALCSEQEIVAPNARTASYGTARTAQYK